ncbi:hypothetical protein [Deinococcus aerophilus]|uniref:Uncharacterized protein n=1 Tax=Deinococcus aerophilus TaxID=522488 RepID=A0ABQ2GLU3_9DEIO|nr:hypothetical protein [Deinococcus aerophilus]GGM01550.1 hypothetical protein GCM10010841_07570 [Deinococcus aerophilus]
MTKTSAPLPALARPLDFSLSSNRFAVLGAGSALLLGRALRGDWRQALGVGGSAFNAWAVARELDPDSPETANAALLVAVAVTLLGGAGNPMGGAASLSGLRLVAGTTGRSATPIDHAALLLQSALAAATGQRSAALLAGLAPLLSAESRALWPAVGAAVPRLWGRKDKTGEKRQGTQVPATVVTLAALALAPLLLAPETVSSRCDRSARRVREGDLQRARQLAVLALLAGLLGRQTRGLDSLAAATLTVGLRRLNVPTG